MKFKIALCALVLTLQTIYAEEGENVAFEAWKQTQTGNDVFSTTPEKNSLWVIHPGLSDSQADLLMNENGTYVSIGQMSSIDGTFFFTNGGGATSDFSRLVLVDNDGNFNMRIRVLNSNLKTLASTISSVTTMKDPRIVFTTDERYFGICLQVGPELIFRIYRTESLEPVAEKSLGSASNLTAQSPSYFREKKRNGKQIEYFTFNLVTTDDAGKPLESRVQFLKFKRQPVYKLRIM